MIAFCRYIYLMFICVAKVVEGIIPYGPTEVQELTPCNTVLRLPANFQTTTIFQLDALDQPPQPIPDADADADTDNVNANATSCAFIFEGPQNTTLTFQLFGITIMRESPFPNDTMPCLAVPHKSSIQIYDYTSEGNLQLISILCQNETWSEQFSTSSNVGVLTSTIAGHFALHVQKVYAAQPSPPAQSSQVSQTSQPSQPLQPVQPSEPSPILTLPYQFSFP